MQLYQDALAEKEQEFEKTPKYTRVFEDLFNLFDFPSVEMQRGVVMSMVQGDESILQYLPLLNTVIALNIPENS